MVTINISIAVNNIQSHTAYNYCIILMCKSINAFSSFLCGCSLLILCVPINGLAVDGTIEQPVVVLCNLERCLIVAVLLV